MVKDLKVIFSENLKLYMKRDDRSQLDIAKAVGASASAVNDWVNAKKYPRMDKVEMLANYFGIFMRDLTEENPIAVTEEERELLSLFKGATRSAKELAMMALKAGQDENRKGCVTSED